MSQNEKLVFFFDIDNCVREVSLKSRNVLINQAAVPQEYDYRACVDSSLRLIHTQATRYNI
jgi:hypothetical protein